jgi:hypothetical protein
MVLKVLPETRTGEVHHLNAGLEAPRYLLSYPY